MAETPGTIRVKVEIEEVVPVVIVAGIANAFAEWLDEQGFALDPRAPIPPDDRSYDELSRDFAEEWASRVPG